MKTFFTKLFLYVCSIIAVLEGFLLLMVASGYISQSDVNFYLDSLMQIINRTYVLLGVGIALFCLGGILCIAALLTSNKKTLILSKEDGEVLQIPKTVIRDFVNQIVKENDFVSNVNSKICRRRKWIYIMVKLVFTDSIPVRQEVKKIRDILRFQLAHMFEFKYFKISFKIKQIKVNYKNKIKTSESIEQGNGIVEKEDLGNNISDIEDNQNEIGTKEEEETKETKLPKRFFWNIFKS